MVFVTFLGIWSIFIGVETEQKFYVYVDFRGDDGKPFYVGKGSEKRVKIEKRNPLHTNIKKKHGMVRKILFENLSESESFEKEIQLIQELRTHIDHGNGGANLTFGGEGVSGYKHTEEQKEVKSKSRKKLWENPEYRKKMREIHNDSEVKKKLSESKKKMWENPEYRKKIDETNNDPKTSKKRSKARKKIWEDPEYREKMSESSKKMWEDHEHREKNSKSNKKLWEDPEYREKVSQGIKNRYKDPEYRAMMKEKQRLGREKKKLEKLQQVG